jgi:phospholipase C
MTNNVTKRKVGSKVRGDIKRREFLKYSSGAVAAVSLSALNMGCSSGSGDGPPEMFVGYPDLPDLMPATSPPRSEIPNAQNIFALPDPVFQGPERPPKSGLATFDHVVAVMFENRTFDNVLGYLPAATATSALQQSINGVVGKKLSNPIPPYALDAHFGVVPVSPATSLQTPLIDPGEEYGSVNVALFNQFNPATNQNVSAETDYAFPYNLPTGGAYFPPPMDGWVRMFHWTLQAAGYQQPTYEQYSSIMKCFPPNQLPAINQLARSFGVCDNYFCGVPSQTIPNRSFFHAAQSSGILINAPLGNWTGSATPGTGNTAATIFDSLTAAGRTWTIYYDDADVISLTRLLHYPTLSKYPFAAPHFKTMKDFHADAAGGNLPDYAFVEPRMFFEDNSYHPLDGAIAAKRGEILLNDVYQSIRQSNSPTGSNFQNTLLMVTFDEGGTCYDHVPPPAATPPFPNKPGQFNFGFDRLGQRIVTILVSAYMDSAVISSQHDSTSMLATLEQKFKLPPLTGRDAAAKSFADVFNRTTPRPRSEWPRLRVRQLSAEEEKSNATLPLNELQIALAGMVYHLKTGLEGLPPEVKDVGTAMAYIRANPV